jgi:hypothetical protein
LLTDPSFRSAAGRMQHEIEEMPDVHSAVSRIESLAR